MGTPAELLSNLPLMQKPLPESSLPKAQADIDELTAQVNEKIPAAAKAFAKGAETVMWYSRKLSPFMRNDTTAEDQKAIQEILDNAEKLRQYIADALHEVKVVLSMFEDLEEWKLIQGDFEDLATQIKPSVIHPYMKNYGTVANESQWHGDTPRIYKQRMVEQSPAALHYAQVADSTASSVQNLARIGAAYYASVAAIGAQAILVLSREGLSLTRYIPLVGPFLGKFFTRPDYVGEAANMVQFYMAVETLRHVLRQAIRSETITMRNTFKRDTAIAPYPDWPDPTTERGFPRVNPDGTISAGVTE